MQINNPCRTEFRIIGHPHDEIPVVLRECQAIDVTDVKTIGFAVTTQCVQESSVINAPDSHLFTTANG